jgi:hypothetical protein
VCGTPGEPKCDPYVGPNFGVVGTAIATAATAIANGASRGFQSTVRQLRDYWDQVKTYYRDYGPYSPFSQPRGGHHKLDVVRAE